MAITSPTFSIQRSGERYFADHGWLKTYHSFSFADYYDPANLHWGALRVFNDDTVLAGAGFPEHPHKDMEIVTYVLRGELEHADSMANRGVVGPGGVQYMSAGTGIRHSEFNHSNENDLRLVQMWVLAQRSGAPPAYGQKEFSVEERLDVWLPVASGAAGPRAPIVLGQDASFYVSRIEQGKVSHVFAPGRLGFLFVAEGQVAANGEALGNGDAVRVAGTPDLEISGSGELVLWDVPPIL